MKTQFETISMLRNEFTELIKAKENGEIELADAIDELNQLKQKVNELLPDEETKQAMQKLTLIFA